MSFSRRFFIIMRVNTQHILFVNYSFTEANVVIWYMFIDMHCDRDLKLSSLWQNISPIIAQPWLGNDAGCKVWSFNARRFLWASETCQDMRRVPPGLIKTDAVSDFIFLLVIVPIIPFLSIIWTGQSLLTLGEGGVHLDRSPVYCRAHI